LAKRTRHAHEKKNTSPRTTASPTNAREKTAAQPASGSEFHRSYTGTTRGGNASNGNDE
jgi:hypothetical protein